MALYNKAEDIRPSADEYHVGYLTEQFSVEYLSSCLTELCPYEQIHPKTARLNIIYDICPRSDEYPGLRVSLIHPSCCLIGHYVTQLTAAQEAVNACREAPYEHVPLLLILSVFGGDQRRLKFAVFLLGKIFISDTTLILASC